MKARPLPERSRSSPAPDLRNHGARLNKVKLVRQPSLSADQAKTGLATEWLGAESNRRHVDFQSTALPTELPSRKLSIFACVRAMRVLTMQQSDSWASARCCSGPKAFGSHSSGAHRAPLQKSEFSRQFHGAHQHLQIMLPQNFNRTELLKMRREPLRVEQGKFSRAQMFH